ncbi:hypothetical protein QZH41_012457 [Actinostola sp. cb2023]|nr:hypothetical protein QZH41_012457 [Actinostola sp. cb2023]
MNQNGQEERTRPRSFRIDDILAPSTETKAASSGVSTTTRSNIDGAAAIYSAARSSLSSPVSVLPLTFGVESLLSPRPSAGYAASRYGNPDIYTHYATSSTTSSQQYSQDDSTGQSKTRRPRRPWTRAVFSNLQRKGLEKRFEVQKYLTKTDRHQLASMLGLSDNQVKVWFQNRRMKWRQDARESVTSTNTEEGES